MRTIALVNEYPKVTHTFVRTAINALEAAGTEVIRVSIRAAQLPLVEAADRLEQARTRVILEAGAIGLVAALGRVAVRQPAALARSLAAALRLGWVSERGILVHLAYVAEACVLQCWFHDEAIDHVHAHFGTNPAAVALLWRTLGGPPFSFTAHGPEEFERAAALSIAAKAHAAAFVAVVSEAGRSHLQQICAPQDWPRIHVVRCAVDARFRSDTDHSHGSYESHMTRTTDSPRSASEAAAPRRLLFIGRFCVAKAPLLLLTAVARLRQQEPPFELVMIGDGPLRRAAEELIRSEQLDSCVQLRGWCTGDEVRQHLLAARALVLPSFAEGLPVVLMEALALQRPVITTYVGGIAELVENGVNGWLVAPGQIEPLADAMRDALNATPQQLAAMGRRGALRVHEQHDAQREALKLAGLIGATIDPYRANGQGTRQARPETELTALSRRAD